jgi:uncharacterized sporulation protein YeaH/YhbH (DUF444 family)
MHIVDRRLNPGGKNFENRQRFLRRAKRMIERAVREASKERAIEDLENAGEITIPAESTRQPTFHHTPGARRDLILPGNREYVEGDRIARPTGAGAGEGPGPGAGGRGREDAFRFVLTRDEFLNIFLDDLELPDLAKRRVAWSEMEGLRRAGFTTTGTPANLSLSRTLRQSLSRRIALGRPRMEEIARLEEELAEAIADGSPGTEHIRRKLETLRRRRGRVAYLDPVDLRYRRFERFPKPVTQAVMFCLMDVSGSMTEHMKDIAKRFFMLLHVFLTRRYKRIELVFIRHTDEAAEVDEETFFHSVETGGTMVSSALAEMVRIVKDRFDPGSWNIYAAQASDGDNLLGDNDRARDLLENSVLPMCQYFAYVEVSESRVDEPSSIYGGQSSLWTAYAPLQKENGKFQMRRVSRRERIFPVFRQLFQRRDAAVHGDSG